MKCPYCDGILADQATVCTQCGKAQPVYAAPEGFALDRQRGLWFRDDTPASAGGAAASVVTWFDPVSGSYTQERRTAAPLPPPPAPPPAAPAVPPPADTGPPNPPYHWDDDLGVPLPDGFVDDFAGGLAYRADGVLHTAGGPVVNMTWYNPATKGYAQIRHRPVAAAVAVAAPAPAPQRAGRAPGRKAGWAVAAIALCLLVAAAVWAYSAGWLPFGGQGDAGTTLPEQTTAGNTATQPPGTTTAATLPTTAPGSTQADTTSQPATDASDSETDSWADSTLEATVRALHRIKDGDPITDEHLADVGFVSVTGDLVYMEKSLGASQTQQGPVISLEDLTRFPNLKMVVIYGMQLQAELEVLGAMTWLEQLYICDNGLTDISALAGLKNLIVLDISANRIEDLSPLEGLEKLRNLYISSNPVANLYPLEKMPSLRTLEADDIPAEDWSPVIGLSEVVGIPEYMAEEWEKNRANGENLVYSRPAEVVEELGYSLEYQDRLWLYTDGMFDLHVNLGGEMGHLSGYWSREGQLVYLDINYCNFIRDESESADRMVFVRDSAGADTLMLDGPSAGLLKGGDWLSLEERY